MSLIYRQLESALEGVRRVTDIKPEVALVLGSGLGDFACECVDIKAQIKYSEIEGFPISTVQGHDGRFIFGKVGDCDVVVMKGRVHYYEGYTMQQVVMPIRLMKMMGANKLILTNAAGGINPNFSVGDLMLITGHISSFVPSPLIGENVDELGTRFPDMTKIYSQRLTDAVEQAACESGTTPVKGVYLQTTGPNYETPQEINMYRILGADAVGMSTACEAAAACHAGMEICGISLISNMAAGTTGEALTHKEVQEAADKASVYFKKTVSAAIVKIHTL